MSRTLTSSKHANDFCSSLLGVSIEEKNGGVFSPLTTSIREDKKDIFYYLIENNADVNAPGEHLPIIKAIRRHRENDLSYIEHLIVSRYLDYQDDAILMKPSQAARTSIFSIVVGTPCFR